MEKREGEMVSDKISWQLLSEMGGSLSLSLSLSLLFPFSPGNMQIVYVVLVGLCNFWVQIL